MSSLNRHPEQKFSEPLIEFRAVYFRVHSKCPVFYDRFLQWSAVDFAPYARILIIRVAAAAGRRINAQYKPPRNAATAS